MAAVVVVLLVFAGALVLTGLVTRVTYLRRHPVSPPSRRRSRLLVALMAGAAAIGIAIGIVTSDRKVTGGHVLGAVVLLAIVTLYGWWRFTPSRKARGGK